MPTGVFTVLGRQTVFARSITTQGTRAYLGAGPLSPQVYILDIRNPRDPDWPIDGDGDGLPDVVLGVVDFPEEVNNHYIADIS